ncbi:MAG: hypothetical protein ABI297_05295 [Ginsengibacter sp.]
MQKFEIILKNDKIKSYRTIAFIILLLNLTVFIFMLFSDEYRFEAASAILLVGMYISMRLYLTKKYNQGNYLDQIILFILAGCWFGFHNYLLFVTLVILGILYHLALQKLQIVFTSEKISKLNFPLKEFEWSVFNNVVLKDNVLTLDFKNNKLIQIEIEKPQNINEQEFNSFVQSQLG